MSGRGRGVAAYSFNVEALGIGRGSMPESRVQPNPLFPHIQYKPVPLKAGEDEDYMLALKQEMRGTMRRLPYHIKPLCSKTAVEKYTERYKKEQELEDEEWTPDWNRFPKELMPTQRKPKTKTAVKTKKKKITSKDAEAVLSKLDELEKKDGEAEKSDEEKPKKKENEEEEEGEEIEGELEEEEIEEENDYIDSYFDNGEDFAPDSDENIDGEATY